MPAAGARMAWNCSAILFLWVLVEVQAQSEGPSPPIQLANNEVSGVAIGFTIFGMLSMYVLKSSNPTLRTGGWLAVSKGLSCFIAVLINMSIYTNLCFFLKDAVPPTVLSTWFTVKLYVCLAFLYWFLKQFILAWSVGMVPCSKTSKARMSGDLELSREELALRLDGIGTIASFCSGSALMQAASSLQQMGRDTEHEDLVVIGIIPAGAIVCLVLFRIGNRLRDWTANFQSQAGFSEAAWGAYMDVAESKGVSLALSHLTVQAIRFYMFDREYAGVAGQLITGKPTFGKVYRLLLYGTVFFLIATISLSLPRSFGRIKQWVRMSSSLAVAWCNFYAINWASVLLLGQSAFNRLSATCAATTLGVMLMVALTQVMSCLNKCGRKQGAATVQDFFIPIAVMIGFSWRDSFSAFLSTLCHGKKLHIPLTEISIEAPPVLTAIASACMLILVTPAWYKWILPVTFKKWVKVPASKTSIVDDDLEATFELPRWLVNDLELKRKDWEHVGTNQALGKALLEEMLHLKDDLINVESDLIDLGTTASSKVTGAVKDLGTTALKGATNSIRGSRVEPQVVRQSQQFSDEQGADEEIGKSEDFVRQNRDCGLGLSQCRLS